MKSWYPELEYTDDELGYFKYIETVFRVQYADGVWRKIILAPHQKEFHRNDLALKFEEALSDDVDKSRNTSFTISSCIRLLTGNYHFRDEEVPIYRINDVKVKELLKEIKKIIDHMQPIQLENGDLWPFDPSEVKYTSHDIKFSDRGITFIAYPASASASDNIRGLRITRGLGDETNFIPKFREIQIAMQDAKRGSFTNDSGNKVSYLQITLGSTMRGQTPYKKWKDNLKQKIKEGKITTWRMLSWPVFDPEVFDSEIPIEEQIDHLTPIVSWHSKKDLAEKFNLDKNSFLEEYMAICVPSDETLYTITSIMKNINEDLNGTPTPQNKDGIFYIGVDVAGGGGDYFTISIFEDVNDKMIERYLYYVNKNVDLDEMQIFCKKLIVLWTPHKCRIDGNGIGYQLSENLKKEFPFVECIRGRQTVKIGRKQSTGLKEFLHTNQMAMFSRGEVELINDEEQTIHYTMWQRNYEAEHSKDHGHGDIVIANGLALLPDAWRMGGRHYSRPGEKEEPEKTIGEVKQEVEDFHNQSIKDRMSFYKKIGR